MSFEKPSMEKPKKLDEEKAHQEANMLRASMRMDPESGKLLRTESEIRGKEYKAHHEDSEALFLKPEEYLEKIATRKDYEVASMALDELEKLAEKDPEILAKIIQFTEASALGLIAPIAILSGILSEVENKLLSSKSKKFGEEIKEDIANILHLKNSIFNDARSKLERLEAKGEKFGQSQNEAEKK